MKVYAAGGMPKLTLGLGDNTKFWVEITGLKNRISESLELDLCVGYVIY